MLHLTASCCCALSFMNDNADKSKHNAVFVKVRGGAARSATTSTAACLHPHPPLPRRPAGQPAASSPRCGTNPNHWRGWQHRQRAAAPPGLPLLPTPIAWARLGCGECQFTDRASGAGEALIVATRDLQAGPFLPLTELPPPHSGSGHFPFSTSGRHCGRAETLH